MLTDKSKQSIYMKAICIFVNTIPSLTKYCCRYADGYDLT